MTQHTYNSAMRLGWEIKSLKDTIDRLFSPNPYMFSHSVVPHGLVKSETIKKINEMLLDELSASLQAKQTEFDAL